MYNFKSCVHDSLCIESLACQNLLVNDAVVRNELGEVVIMFTEGNKTSNLTCNYFASSVVMEQLYFE
jgi:hypothetical protein